MTTLKLTCGFEEIIVEPDFFRSATLEKGKKLFQANHVGQTTENRYSDSTEIKITAKCLSQVRTSTVYDVNIMLDRGRLTQTASCSCRAGKDGKCKHAAAVIYFINNYKDETCTTDSANFLEVPPSFLLEKFADLKCPLVTVLMTERDMENRLPLAAGTKDSSQCAGPDEVFVAFMKYALTCHLAKVVPGHRAPEELEEFYFGMVANENEELLTVAWSTVKQSLCPQWYLMRKIRISSTKAHPIKTRQRDFHALARQLVQTKFRGNANTDYGISMEPVGRQTYVQATGTKIIEVGLIVCGKIPWLCASPDGIVVSEDSSKYKLLEIKSPSSRKGVKIIDRDENKSFVPYLDIRNGKPELKRNHPYFTQIQVSMLVANVTECDLFIHSSCDSVICNVHRDDTFLVDVIAKLEKFYFEYLLPEIVDAF